MKYTIKYTFSIIFLLLAVMTHAQAPQGIPYQAIARNSSGAILASTNISVRFSIRDSIATGAIKYRETHSVTTSAQGMFSLNVGQGTPVTGTFAGINWGTNAKFMQVEMDPTSGSSYIDMGTTKMMSVPYALYANQSGVPGAVDLPTVTTGPISSITYTGAVSTDTLKANGGEYIFAKGVCIDTISLPAINKSIVSPGNTVGSYTLSLTGLLPGKTYYARAFASNKNGTAYGNVVSFSTTALSLPTLTTDTITGITNSGASGGGTISSDGGSPVTSRGLCYATVSNPTIANSLSPSGSGTGSFSTTLSGLTSSVTYYVRAYATNSVGTSYGSQRTFTTIVLSVPTITTDTVSGITCTGVISGLNCSNNGGSTITSQGVCYGTSPSPTTSGLKVTTANGVGHFSATISGLAPGTAYYVRAYSTNSSGTVYGAQYTFTTLPLTAPTISTNSIIGVSTTSATSGGNITNDGCATVSVRGVCWSKFATPTKDSTHTSDGSGTGIFNSNMTGLLPGTTYYVRAYATNSSGTGYGGVVTFTTDSVLSGATGVPVVGTTAPTISASSNISGGYVTISPGSSVTARGVCWGTSPMPTISGSHSSDGSGLGFFSSTLSLTGCATTYYIRAYATNSAGTGYGNQVTITAGALPVLVDSPITNVTGVSAVSGGSVISDGGCSVTEKGICWGITANPTIVTGSTSWKTTNGSGTGSFKDTLTGLYNNYTYHMRTYATNGSGTVYGPDQVFTTGISSTLAIGQTYAGGIIFYLDSTGNHGLVCAATDLSTAPWGCWGTSIAGTANSLGAGQVNSAIFMANCSESGTAVKLCDDYVTGGYSDWYLPSKDELDLIRINLSLMNIGDFILGSAYWTSSEINNNQAWLVGFNNGPQTHLSEKYFTNRVRAVRSF